MVIGLAAYRFINQDVSFNLSQMARAMEAAQGKADLLCFGETFLQGFDALNWDYRRDRQVGIAQDSAVIGTLCALTGQYGVDLLFGYVEKAADKIYSSCMVIADGGVRFNYRRMSKGWKMYSVTDAHYCEGTDSPDFLYKGKVFRIALCGDLWEFPERFWTDGVLLWPVYTNFSRPEWEAREGGYARQASLAARKTLLVNSLSQEPEAIGGAFCLEDGRITTRLPYQSEGILYVPV